MGKLHQLLTNSLHHFIGDMISRLGLGFLPLPPSWILYIHKQHGSGMQYARHNCLMLPLSYLPRLLQALGILLENFIEKHWILELSYPDWGTVLCDLLSQFAPRLILFYLLLIRLRNSVCCTEFKKVLTFKMAAYDLHSLTMWSLFILMSFLTSALL